MTTADLIPADWHVDGRGPVHAAPGFDSVRCGMTAAIIADGQSGPARLRRAS